MKSLLLCLIVLLVWPLAAQAHGGSSKVIGNAIVTLNQNPLSPLTGERVAFNFKLTDFSGRALPDVSVKLALIDTFYGDASKDQTILQEEFKTDVNGTFDFDRTFSKENYFDLDLTFNDPVTGQEEQTGFLVQPRDGPDSAGRWKRLAYVQTGLALVLLVVFTIRQRKANT
jgi:hypothetical protein